MTKPAERPTIRLVPTRSMGPTPYGVHRLAGNVGRFHGTWDSYRAEYGLRQIWIVLPLLSLTISWKVAPLTRGQRLDASLARTDWSETDHEY